ncbi:MBL fold metallo-hydrolase [Lyngbya confervoides]|uniref:MBL fold metallo-hydrolase n=1 Tax=Lyngbya confervoides BDU141951 TaxID=1574623 RepID=A0ABD4T0B5_9CYAN|nr:MBL fold metallo-hydrolase [Lyngbya confervoides]MCM1981805.1 MBL fold metallo-hydrolase [Lyngbya confervoides BDU141951]
MHRRKFFRLTQLSVISALSTALVPQISARAQSAGSLTVEWLGHSCFLLRGSGNRILINPFQPAGCTANYRAPNVTADLVFISSRLLDEGAIENLPGQPKLLFEPGTYRPNGLSVQGIRTLHDRYNGYRFGTNVAWKWQQAGINILHLGGIASEIGIEQKILMGQPDLLFIPVGGSEKAYTAEEAKQAIDTLQPKVVIPMHYLTAAANPELCDLESVDKFLELMSGRTINRTGRSSLTFQADTLPRSGPVIQVMAYS